jgi:hypothetical protein
MVLISHGQKNCSGKLKAPQSAMSMYFSND